MPQSNFGGFAYPSEAKIVNTESGIYMPERGMTLCVYFARQALASEYFDELANYETDLVDGRYVLNPKKYEKIASSCIAVTYVLIEKLNASQ